MKDQTLSFAPLSLVRSCRCIARREVIVGAVALCSAMTLRLGGASAQSLGRMRVAGGCNFDGSEARVGEVEVLQASNRVEQAVARILDAGGLPMDVRALETFDPLIPNARAMTFEGMRYVLVNRSFQVGITESVELESLIAHEVGHHVLGHSFESSLALDRFAEAAADRWAGGVCATLSLKSRGAPAALYRFVPKVGNDRYLGADQRAHSFSIGYANESRAGRNIRKIAARTIGEMRGSTVPSATAWKLDAKSASRAEITRLGELRRAHLTELTVQCGLERPNLVAELALEFAGSPASRGSKYRVAEFSFNPGRASYETEPNNPYKFIDTLDISSADLRKILVEKIDHANRDVLLFERTQVSRRRGC